MQNEEQLKAARSLSVKEGTTYSVMDGFGLRNITPFALAIGATNAHIGLLSSIPALFGNISQLLTAKAMERWPRKTLVTVSVFLQALMWLPIALIALLAAYGIDSPLLPGLLVIVYTLITLFGAFAGPAWTSWMGDLVTSDAGSYFGRRNRICGIVSLIAMLLGGLVLDASKNAGIILFGFAALFGISFLSRSIGAYIFTRKYEPAFTPQPGYYFSLWQFVKKMRHNNFGRFAIGGMLVQFGTAIGGPFVAVYMLNGLHFSYTTFTLVNLAAPIATLLFMPAWGKFADRYGTIRTIRITAGLTPLVIGGWACTPLIIAHAPALLIPCLLCVELFSGFVWSGFNLSFANFIYAAVTRERIGVCTAYVNILNGTGVFVGAALGGALASLPMPLDTSPFIIVFIISATLRLIAFLWMRGMVHEVRPVHHFDIRLAREKLLSLSPGRMLEYLDLRLR